MRTFLLVALTPMLLARALPASAQTPGLDTQTITRHELALHGTTQLAQVFWLSDRIRMTSIDGFSVLPSIGGLSPSQLPAWQVRIDGRRIDLGILDFQNINLLPVTVSAIDSIVVVASPSIQGATIYDGGRIDIWTTARSSADAASAMASFSAANETGDPGPFRLTRPELAKANVDKTGPDGYLDLRFTRPRSSIVAGGNVFQFIPSDTAVFARNRAAFDTATTPENVFIMPYGAYQRRDGDREMSFRIDGLFAEDMTLFREFSRELPTRLSRARLDASTRYPITARYRVVGGVTGHATSLRNMDAATRRPLDWNEKRLRVDLALERPGVRGFWGVAVEVDHTGVESANAAAGRIDRTDVSASINGAARRDRWSVSAAGAGVVRGESVGGSLVIGVEAPIGSLSVFSAGTSFSRRPDGADGQLFYYLRGGLRLGGHSVTLPPPAASSLLSVDVGYTRILTPTTRFSVRGFARSASNYAISSRSVVSDGLVFALDRSNFVLADGSLLGAAADIRHVSGRRRHAASYSWQTEVGADPEFEAAWREMPRHRVSARSSWQIAPTFSVFVAGWYFSSAYWTDYVSIVQPTSGRYGPSVSSFGRIDSGFAKSVFSGFANVRISLQNLLNDRVGFHPIGATFDRTIKVELILSVSE